MGIQAVLKDFFIKGSPLSGKPVYTDNEARKAYRTHESITSKLPWLDIIENNKLLLSDAKSVAAVFDITPIATEARSEGHLRSIRDNVQRFIGSTFEEYDTSPWVVQIYSWCDRPEFRKLPEQMLAHAIKVHAARDAVLDDFSKHFINHIWADHIEQMAVDGGLFRDELTENTWGGSKRMVYMVIYRRYTAGMSRRRKWTAESELDAQCGRVQKMLRSAGLKGKRVEAEALWSWFFRWFNPRPKLTEGNVDAWLTQHPLPKEEDRSAEFDMTADMITRDIRSDAKTGCWYFDGMPHTVLSVERMSKVPDIGQTSAERYDSKEETSGANARASCMIDELPEGSIIAFPFVVKPQKTIRNHLDRLEKSAKGNSPEADKTRMDVDIARRKMLHDAKLYPYTMLIAARAEDDDAMDDVLLSIDTILNKNNLSIIDPEHDEFRLDRYLRVIPCAYDPALKQNELRQRIIYTDHLANVIPFYGRGTGTGSHCMVNFNRGGEAFCWDPLLKGERVKNAHLFLFGPTGAGKSATLILKMMMVTAVYDPRWVVVEAGNSFGLLSQYLAAMGKTTADLVFRKGVAPSLAPYKPALDLFDDNGRPVQDSSIVEDVLVGEASIEIEEEAEDDEDTNIDDVQRDILGEMIIIARLMVTGGEEKEEYKMSRADVGILKKAILDAASEAKRSGKTELLTEDVERALRNQVHDKPNAAERITEMADAMSLFCDGFAGELFNRPGDPLPDVDYIRIEMADLASGNDTNDKLSVAYISIINQVIARAQRTQRDGRPTINLTDEAHVITCNPLLANYLIVVSKLLGRRMGLWLWQATQNMDDYKGDSAKMLAMFEWWMLLKVDKDEITKVENVREISPDQRSMILSSRKQDKAYTEGVVLSDTVQGLFRVVQPPICLALAGTDKEEKRARYKMMKKHNITEVKAVEKIAEEIAGYRRRHAEEMRQHAI